MLNNFLEFFFVPFAHCIYIFFCLCRHWHFGLIHRDGCTKIVCTVCKKKVLYTMQKRWRLSVFGWRLSVFGWRLSVFCWRLSVFGWRLSVFGWRLSVFGWRLSVFGWRLFLFLLLKRGPFSCNFGFLFWFRCKFACI